MKNNFDKFSAIDPNPALRVKEDGTILYSNKAGEHILKEWGRGIDEKIPSSIGDIVKTVVSFNSPKKMELKVGKRVYLIVFHPLQEEKCVFISGFDMGDQEELGGKTQENESKKMVEVELSELIEIQAIQSLINELNNFTHLPIGLTDSKNNIILGVRWQEICTRFHRANPETYKYCLENEIKRSYGAVIGKSMFNRCKNNLCNVASPIIVANRQIGTIFLGQFLFEDEVLDYELFRSQARKYGFDEKEYISALEKVPRLSREAVETGTTLITSLANFISQLSYSNVKLVQSLSERDILVDALRESEKSQHARSEELAVVLDAVPAAVMIAHDPGALKITGNRLSYEWIRVPDGTNISKSSVGNRPETHKLFKNGVEIPITEMPMRMAASGTDIQDYEFDMVYPDGMIRHVLGNFRSLRDEQGNFRGSVSALIDITERKKTEDSLRKSLEIQETLKNIIYKSPAIAFLWKNAENWPAEFVSENVIQLGYTVEDFKSGNILYGDIIHKEDIEAVNENLKRSVREVRNSFEMEYRIFTRKGEIRWVKEQTFIQRDSKGEVTYFQGIVIDITENKKAEGALNEAYEKLQLQSEELQAINEVLQTQSSDLLAQTEELQDAYHALSKSEERYRMLFTNMTEAFFLAEIIYTEDGKPFDFLFVEINPAFELQIGRTKENILIKSFREIFSSISSSELEHFVEITHSDKATNFEIFIPELGKYFDVYVFSPEKGKIAAILKNITDRKQMEEALLKSEEKYRSIVETSNESIIIIDNETKVTYANNKLEDMFGYSLEEVIGKPIWGFVSEESKAIVKQILENEWQSINESLEIRLICRDGSFLWAFVNAKSLFDKDGKIIGIIAMLTDITERKNIEEALLKSEEKYRNIVETSNECIIIADKESKITYANKRLEEVFGYSLEDTIGKPIWGFISEESMPIFEKLPENGWQGINESFEVKLIGRDGSFLWSLINVKSLVDNEGQFMGVLGMLTDITKRKDMEDVLRENEEKYRNIVETSNEGISLNDGKGLLTYANQKMAEMLGYDINEIIGKNILDFVVDIDDSVVTNSIQRQLQDNIQSYDFKLLRKDRSPLWVFVNIKSFFSDDGKFIGSLNMFTDITERKNADMKLKETLDNLESLVRERTSELEKAYNSLKESEQSLTEAQKIAHIGSWEWDTVTEKFSWSEEMYRIFGLSPQGPTPNYKELFEYIHPEDRDYFLSIIAKNEKHIDFDFRIILADGEERTVNIQTEIFYNERNIPIKTKGTIQDITERKLAEEKKKLLASIVESSNDAIGTLSLDGIITSWNKGAEQVYGYSQEEVLGKSVSIVAPFNVDKETTNLIEKARQGEKIRNFETLRLRKDGKTIHVSLTLSPLVDILGNLSAISIISRDITERKMAEEKLRESEEKYRNIVETANEGIVVSDRELRVSYVNKKMADILGCSNEDIIGRYIWDFIAEESREFIKANLEKRNPGFKEQHEAKLLHNDGSLIWAHISGKVLYDEDEFLGILAMISDITERKKAEEELWKSENRFRVMFEEHGAPMLLIEPNSGQVIDANKAAVLFYEYSREQLQAMFIDQINQSPPKVVASECYNAVECNKNVFIFTHRLASGDERLVEVYSSPVTIQGQLLLFSIIHDITQRKKAEEALRESEEKYRSIVETANEGIIITNKESTITYLNKKMADMLGYTVEEIIGKPIWYFHTEETKSIVKSNLIKRQQGIENLYEAQLMHKDGSLIWVTINAKCLIDKNGEFMGSLGMLSDVTKRKEAEQVLANLEIARKQEIHHRIKNNLQVISSLLDLQSEKFRDKKNINDLEVMEAFKKSQDRVISMALIHEELHKGEGLDELNFVPYIKELTDNLFLTSRPDSTEVNLYMDLEENIVFDMDIAVPLGIIVNELVSNSLKYAFPGRDYGEIKIIFRREKRDLISIEQKNECDNPKIRNFILTISDNGLGIPEDIDLETPESLGLQLVVFLVDQLDGTLELKRDNGTAFIIRFAVMKK